MKRYRDSIESWKSMSALRFKTTPIQRCYCARNNKLYPILSNFRGSLHENYLEGGKPRSRYRTPCWNSMSSTARACSRVRRRPFAATGYLRIGSEQSADYARPVARTLGHRRFSYLQLVQALHRDGLPGAAGDHA